MDWSSSLSDAGSDDGPTACPTCGRENPPSARFCNACGMLLAGEQDQRRKPATLLFADVAGSTALAERIDAEAVRELMLAYFREMRGAIEAHGGIVEKFIGDAVVGVFGVPAAHEDDALRGVRAAVEMQERLATLNTRLEQQFGAMLSIRIGINTGEVVAGDTTRLESFVSGDAVNVAARLEQAAPPDGVLLGEATHALVEHAVEAELIPPLAVKGKTSPLNAYRLVGIRADTGRAKRATPLVGRERELAVLTDAIDRLCSSGSPSRALVVGDAGVGKSRLVEAAMKRAGKRASVVTVRCLPYGEDITYFPLGQLVRQVARIEERDGPSDALRRIESAFAGQSDAPGAGAILAQVLGLAEGAPSADEIAWAARRLLEVHAGDRPQVLVVDDLQWAKEPLVRLLAGIAERVRAPILVLGVARPEFAARQSDWVPDVRLEPLAPREAKRLLEQIAAAASLAPESQSRLLDAAGGNPLFLGELVAYVDVAGDSSDLPPTLEALLNARLDARPDDERRALECAAIEGEVFHRGAVLALVGAPHESTVDDSLARLAEDALVRPAKPSLDDEAAFRFHHLLLRDAAYRSTAKRRRADLHLLFAAWLQQKLGPRLPEAAEIVGYHLEQVCVLRGELGPIDADTRAVGGRASDLLDGAGRRSLARGDGPVALNLFTRAAALALDDLARIDITLRRGVAAQEAADLALGEAVLADVEREAEQAGLEVVAARAQIELALLRFHRSPTHHAPGLRRVGEETLATFERLGDDEGLALALSLLAHERWLALRCAESERMLERALDHGERVSNDRLIASTLVALARAVLFGPRPADEAASRCEELLARARRLGPTTEASISIRLAPLEAMRGNAERARRLARDSIAVLEETASELLVAGASQYAGLAELVLDDAARAARQLRRSLGLLEQLGDRSRASSSAALLSRALVALGDLDESDRFSALALEWGGRDDIVTQAYAHGARALSLLARGAGDAALAEARLAVELSAASDFASQRGDAFFDLAVVLQACGDEPGARRAADEAVGWFVAKGNVAAAERAEALAAAVAR
jgi:class 3 adenylate cyclase/tetratricopeptide (TPR) repeat protein